MKKNRFYEDLLRVRGEAFSFVKLGMAVKFNGESGTIIGFHRTGNFIVKMKDNEEAICHPTYKMEYFDDNGNLIKSFY